MARGTSFQRSSVAPLPEYTSPFQGNAIYCFQTLCITPELIIEPQFNFRSTKIIATLGPASWSGEKLAAMLEGGVSITRLVVGLQSLVRRVSGADAGVVKALGHPAATVCWPALLSGGGTAAAEPQTWCT